MRGQVLTRAAASILELTVPWASRFTELSPEVPGLKRRSQHVEHIGRSGLLGRRLRVDDPLLLAIGKAEGAVGVIHDVALLEHQVHLLLHATELLDVLLSCCSLLLHLLEAPHLLGDLTLLLLLLELLVLDLDPGLAALGGGLHEVARLTLGD